jgi:hypothetical protein
VAHRVYRLAKIAAESTKFEMDFEGAPADPSAPTAASDEPAVT